MASFSARGFNNPPPGYKYNEIDMLVPIDPSDPNTPPLGTFGSEPKPKKKDFNDFLDDDFVCPDPEMKILMSDGSQKRAGDLVVGDLVKTYHEKDLEKASELAHKKALVLASGGTEEYSQLREQLESSYAKPTLGEYKVEFIDIIKDVEKIKLTFEGSEIICSLSHKFYVNNSWKEARELKVGDEVSDKKLISKESVENGDVIFITIKDAHTYICEGLLSHNKSPRIDKDEDKEFDPGPFVQDDDGPGKSATADSYFDLDRFSDLLQKLEGSKKRQQRQRSVEGRRDIFAGGLAKMMSNF